MSASPIAQVFAALQRWQTSTGSSDETAELALQLTDGDTDAAHALLLQAAAMWEQVRTSAAQPFRTGEDATDIGPAHGRARKTAAA